MPQVCSSCQYYDAEGEAHKAFVLPQKDPAFYDTFLDTYNVIELVKSRVKSMQQLRRTRLLHQFLRQEPK